ncbi:MAG: ABC transporter ATP-binding protein [Verrucomicrobia bacterium]|nr:ABC transporter ATP-binding protein [Verrucomicrobiota bacterium]
MNPVLRAHNLSRVYPTRRGTVAAVDGVSLEIGNTEFVAVCGRSGSGKSTLMALLGTLARPDQGALELEGTDLLSLSPGKLSRLRAKRIGFLLQTNSLLPGLTALDNAALPGILAGENPDSSYDRARQWLTRLGMEGRWDAFPQELSGGQQRRVALARALQHSPALLLLDEPTSNLDPRAEEEILHLLRELRDERKIAIFAVTHGDNLASLADRVLQMSAGRLTEGAVPRAPAKRSEHAAVLVPVFEAVPAGLAPSAPTAAPESDWRGPLSFFFATLVLGISLVFGFDRVVAWTQSRQLWAREEKKRVAEEIAFRHLRADMESVQAKGQGRVEADLFLQNYDPTRTFFILGPSLRAFYQADGRWEPIPLEDGSGNAETIREVLPTKTLVPLAFTLLPAKYDELIRGYFHIRFTGTMVVSETRDATGDLFERQDDYYIYLKDPRLTDDQVRQRNGWKPGSVVPPWMAMPSH